MKFTPLALLATAFLFTNCASKPKDAAVSSEQTKSGGMAKKGLGAATSLAAKTPQGKAAMAAADAANAAKSGDLKGAASAGAAGAVPVPVKP
jgi:hypothetical protein